MSQQQVAPSRPTCCGTLGGSALVIIFKHEEAEPKGIFMYDCFDRYKLMR